MASETKKVFSASKLTSGQCVCVEISLKTAEGETMILETWWLTMVDAADPNARISYTVYNRMGVLLKSLFCVSRATPAYRLSRKQGPETFVVCYRIYLGEPHTDHLGSGYETTKVGCVPSPVGTITLSVAYRTKMLISPHQSRDMSVDLKDDHFNSETTAKRKNTTPKPCHKVYKEPRFVLWKSSHLELMSYNKLIIYNSKILCQIKAQYINAGLAEVIAEFSPLILAICHLSL